MEHGPSRRQLAIGGWLILVLAGALAAMPLLPPGAPVEPTRDAFSGSRTDQLIDRLAVAPRPIGSAANERARARIADELRQLGLAPELQAVSAPDYFRTQGGSSVEVVNVLARIPGRASTGAVVLAGHYDTVPTSPGANDDAAAVAVILEVARVILAGPPLRNDVILLLTDGEEPAPRFGASAFVAEHPWAGEVAFVVNVEAIGADGPAMLIALAGPPTLAVEGYATSVPHPVAFSYLTATRTLIGGSISDFDAFQNAGAAGVELAYLHGPSIYHTMADAPGRVSTGSLQHLGESVLAITRHVAGVDLEAPTQAEPTVFLTIGRTVIRYPAALAPAAVMLAAAMLILAMAVAARSPRRSGWRPVLRGLLAAVLALVATVAGAVVIWSLVAAVRTDVGLAESYLYLAGLAALAWAVHAVVRRLTAARSAPASSATGVVAAWWLLGSPIALAVPEIGYLLMWPTLVAGAVLLLRATVDRGGWLDLAGFALVATTALVLVIPAVDTFYQLAQPRPGNTDSQLLWLIAIPAALVALVIELLAAFWPRSAGVRIPGAPAVATP